MARFDHAHCLKEATVIAISGKVRLRKGRHTSKWGGKKRESPEGADTHDT
jgi:hypothetical protein